MASHFIRLLVLVYRDKQLCLLKLLLWHHSDPIVLEKIPPVQPGYPLGEKGKMLWVLLIIHKSIASIAKKTGL